MVQTLTRYHKAIAWFFVVLFYLDLVITPAVAKAGMRSAHYPRTAMQVSIWNQPATAGNAGIKAPEEITAGYNKQQTNIPATIKRTATTGPTQPEMQQFSSANSSNMVDLFSGDFSYNIPLMDVGGYPVTLGYRGGISMDQEASWCGLGWNINPGTISRNLRGLPDDFNGTSDSVKKITSIRENKTIGVTGGIDVEIVGLPKGEKGSKDTTTLGTVGASLGIFHNNYKGWGIERGINASINSAIGARGVLTGGLSITNNSQEGLSLSPSISVSFKDKENLDNAWMGGSYSIGSTYNTRSGIKGLQLTPGIRQYGFQERHVRDNIYVLEPHGAGSVYSSFISFASPSYNPSITMPFTSTQYSFTAKVGWEQKVYHPSAYLSGYVSKQRIAPADTLLALPSYGYLYFQDGARNSAALLDFNREKEIPYREKPAVPHIAVPAYTYDAFSITGEGTGGMFRAYRGDIGFVYDHYIRSKDESNRMSIDVGLGDVVHGGVDLNINRAFTQNGPWTNDNPLHQVIDFKYDSANYEAVYFRNPGEKSINSKKFYDALGGDDVVTVGLAQTGRNGSDIQTINELWRYKDKRKIGGIQLTPQNVIKTERDKRTQVISYLSAKEAESGGLSRYIDNYAYNAFNSAICGKADFDNFDGPVRGLQAEYFGNRYLSGKPVLIQTEDVIDHDWGKRIPDVDQFKTDKRGDRFSVRWTGRVYAPETGTYTFFTNSDDGVRLWIADSLVINNWSNHGNTENSAKVNLIKDQLYKIRLEFYDNTQHAVIRLQWKKPGETVQTIVPKSVLYPPAKDTYTIGSLTKEKRINNFRKPNHISEITVLNNDGRRYVYGLPVYNLKQREATFAVNGKDNGNTVAGLVKYAHGSDNSTNNMQGKDRYYNSEEVPAYAHSFLLTGILSADYSDITGNGISDDDIGDAVKFNYSKISGIASPFMWRAPAAKDSVMFNEGLKTDYRDDKGSYVYGEKELWYLHSIESKTMLATFVLEDRDDLPAVDEAGNKIYNHTAKRLKEINLYSKADFMKKGANARPVKTVHFEYGYELCPGMNTSGGGKLTLKKVWFTYNGNNKGKQNPYVFSYNATNPSYNTKSYDRWGNYKDPLQNPGSATGNLITNAEYPYALQDSTLAAQNAAAWTLDSIYLPSGGSIKVQYESDDYAYVQNKRAMQLFKLAGLGNSPVMPATPSSRLYNSQGDQLYVFVKVPRAVSTVKDVYNNYLQDVSKLYFKLFVKMPGDKYGDGYEYVTCYADLDIANSYGVVNSNTIWVKMAGISLKGDGGGSYSPLAKAGIQFLRLNLPSKAYPGSETGDDMDLAEGVKMLASLAHNVQNAFYSFDQIARNNGWATNIDTSRSFVRLNNPYFKKYGGGQRVKRVIIYDNWDKMTNQRAALYGQEYIYTTKKEIDGVNTTISSGVASWEPGLGGEENPFRVPIEYVEKIAPLGPVTLGYTEEPLGESFFPAAGIGYSCVRTRTIHYKNKKSANGYDETLFYTAYDFPTYTDRTLIDADTKKRYKPALANFLRINAQHYLALSQGFRIELNDMHGKLRSKASYAETDAKTPVVSSEYFYKVENKDATFKRLSNTVMVMKPDGIIDSAALIGKDVELMVDMREQLSITNGYNVNLNTEMFSVPFIPPLFLIPSILNLAQREKNVFQTVATVKIIQRYGIVDSVISVDKGSIVSTKDILYDSETGDVLVSRTQNEFNDYVYSVSYPSHWAYDGMGPAYKNIGANLQHVSIRNGKLTGASDATLQALFSSGDEILVAGKQLTEDKPGCVDSNSTFPVYNKIWAVDSSVLYGGPHAFYFIDRAGKPYNGYDISLKVIRSGRRNMFAAVGSVACLKNPLVKNESGQYELIIDTTLSIIAASAGEFRQLWKTGDIMARDNTTTCIPIWRPSGDVRCVQVNGVNTGEQEAEEVDINPRSSTYNTPRWVSLGMNCITCGGPANWKATGNTRCLLDSLGNNTGYQEREEIDSATCSASMGEMRWVLIGLNCAACQSQAKWINEGGPTCEQVGGVNTGNQVQVLRDTAICSPTYNTTQTVSVRNCAACQTPAKWVNDGSPTCEQVGGVNTGNQLQVQRDTATCSPTYNTTQTVSVRNCVACQTPAKWINEGNPTCEQVGGVNTGNQLQVQRDTATCSPTYNTTQTVSVRNCAACQTPAKWINEGSPVCETAGGVNTGRQLQPQRDTSICSPTYNTTRTDTIQNCAQCSKPPNWQIISNHCDSGFISHEFKHFRRITLQDMDSCSAGYLTTRDSLIMNDPECNCIGLGQKWINGVCEPGTLRCREDAVISPTHYRNCYWYEFSDNSVSSDSCVVEFTQCFSAGSPAALSIPQEPETRTDLFYRSVLPKEKYELYRQKQYALNAKQ